jgi:hypothetical protein
MLAHISSRIRGIHLPCSLLNISTNAQITSERMLGYQRKNEAGNLSEFCLNLLLNISVHLLKIFCPPKSSDMKFHTR